MHRISATERVSGNNDGHMPYSLCCCDCQPACLTVTFERHVNCATVSVLWNMMLHKILYWICRLKRCCFQCCRLIWWRTNRTNKFLLCTCILLGYYYKLTVVLGDCKHWSQCRLQAVTLGRSAVWTKEHCCISLRIVGLACQSTNWLQPPGQVRSTVMSISVWLSVCLSIRSHNSKTTRPIFTNFICMMPMAIAQSSSDGVAIC